MSNSFNEPTLPDVPMALLTSLPLQRDHWIAIARNASWQTARMNLNTFERHGVLTCEAAVLALATKLRDRDQVLKAKAFPYQLLVAFSNAVTAPAPIRDALQDALEIATRNVPSLNGKVWVLVDVSGSMHSPVTGGRKGATTKVRCIDVAALIAASVARKNPQTGIVPFSTEVVPMSLNMRDSVMTNAQRLASLPSGGTNCSAPFRWLNHRNERGDFVILVSDNESWMDSQRGPGPTETLRQWSAFKARNPRARLVCLDLQPNAHTQAPDHEDVLNVGGFSDAVFDVIARFMEDGQDASHWVDEIRRVAV